MDILKLTIKCSISSVNILLQIKEGKKEKYCLFCKAKQMDAIWSFVHASHVRNFIKHSKSEIKPLSHYYRISQMARTCCNFNPINVVELQK